MKNSEEALFFLCKAIKDKENTISLKDGVFTFTPSVADYQKLKSYGLLNNSGNITPGGYVYNTFPNIKKLSNKVLEKKTPQILDELADRIYSDQMTLTPELEASLDALLLVIASKVKSEDQLMDSMFPEITTSVEIVNEVVVEKESKVKKTKKSKKE